MKDIDLNDDVDPLIFEVLTSENSIPMIVVDEYDNIVSFNNIDPQRALLKDSLLLKNTLKDLKKQNDPIEIVFENAVVGEGKIELSLLEEKDRVLINVIDTGKGIPKRLVKRIFQPGVTTKKRGWGLGLSLCRRIIEDYHQGSIQVRSSSKDKGTHFEIVLNK